MPSAHDTWIVVPAYNESTRLPATLSGLLANYSNVVVVDDGSHDSTAAVAHESGAWVLQHLFNCGQGAALQTGITFALQKGAKYIVTFDADGQHDPAEIDQLLLPLREGHADVTLGSRFLGQTVDMPWGRRIVLKLAVLFTLLASRIKVTDAHNGLRAFTRAAASKLALQQNRMAHASEMLDLIRRHQLKFVEVPVTIRYSAETLAKGQTSLSAVKIASDLLLGRMIK
jgi:glycosyltransferase involved in cell wall biosynthesis